MIRLDGQVKFNRTLSLIIDFANRSVLQMRRCKSSKCATTLEYRDRMFDHTDFKKDYSLSDRDIRHKFNFYTYAELGKGFEANARIQARSAQPITPSPRIVNGVDLGRNSVRKDNKFFSFDWRVQRAFKLGEHMALMPVLEMFNTFNNANNVNPLTTVALFNFDGFLRQGVGDPRQVQLALKFTF